MSIFQTYLQLGFQHILNWQAILPVLAIVFSGVHFLLEINDPFQFTEISTLIFTLLIIISIFAATHHGMRKGLVGIKKGLAEGGLQRWNLFAGMLGGIFVAIQTNTVPLIGVAIYSVASISGQTASSLIVDSLGLAGGAKKHITSRRIVTGKQIGRAHV